MAETTQKAEHEDGSSWHLPVQKQKKDASLALSPLELAASTDSFMDTAATAEISLSGHDLPGTPEQGPAIDDSFDSTNGALVRDDGTTLPRPDSASPDCDAVDGSIFGKAMREAERADDLLIPPLNFGRVCRGVYRSGFPGKKNFTFLKKLKLHTVLNLSEHEYSKESIEFLSDNQIEWTHMPILGNREPMQSTDEALLCKALLQVLRATADRWASACGHKRMQRAHCLALLFPRGRPEDPFTRWLALISARVSRTKLRRVASSLGLLPAAGSLLLDTI